MIEFLISFALLLLLAGAIFGWIIGIWLVVTHIKDKRQQRHINLEVDEWVRRYNAYNAGLNAAAYARARALENIGAIVEAGMKRTPLQRKRELKSIAGGKGEPSMAHAAYWLDHLGRVAGMKHLRDEADKAGGDGPKAA